MGLHELERIDPIHIYLNLKKKAVTLLQLNQKAFCALWFFKDGQIKHMDVDWHVGRGASRPQNLHFVAQGEC